MFLSPSGGEEYESNAANPACNYTQAMKPESPLRKPTAVFHQSGALQPGYGKITGVIAFALSGMAVLSVLAFHFPEYLTTPD